MGIEKERGMSQRIRQEHTRSQACAQTHRHHMGSDSCLGRAVIDTVCVTVIRNTKTDCLLPTVCFCVLMGK